MRVWSRCDRCDFKIYAHRLKCEASGLAVCPSCYDGAFDLKRHPQNRAAPPRREGINVPGGRPQQILYAEAEMNGAG